MIVSPLKQRVMGALVMTGPRISVQDKANESPSENSKQH